MLTPERLIAVHSALDSGRYVEIRGNAGVGKSAVLKHFAQQISAETAVIALSPTRTVPKGWLALQNVLGFDGTAHDLLLDLAGSGSAALFVDGLDFFRAEERSTVIDLVREAAKGWLAAHSDDREFWIGQAVGRRVCLAIEAILKLTPSSFAPEQPARRQIDDVLGKLIRLGVAEAHRLEKALREIQ